VTVLLVLFHRTLLQVFKENASLAKLVISNVDLRSGKLAESLSGLEGNKTLRTLIFDHCYLDNAAMSCFVQTLQSPNIGLNEVGLPGQCDEEVDEIQDGRVAFLRGLANVPTIQKVHFGRSLPELDDESLTLLLRTVKESKNIHVFDDFVENDHDDEFFCCSRVG
jgi:hypothetical protein